MRRVKTKAKAYELAQQGRLFFIDSLNGRYAAANVGLVISSFDKIIFYYRP